ncbi:MAG: helix-turn-helix domain-containing protein [Lachnoclostridium sp.]|nr:helix-turn-helix domain-containing protein [Lachnoclostridium sp.]
MAKPYCHVVNYDEDSGLSQRLVKGIVQDNDGVIWIATWNGLNRFDGKEFVSIRPSRGDLASKFSNRIGVMKLTHDGNLLLRIDGRLLSFDTRTYKFTDLHADIEKMIGEPFSVRQIIPTTGREVVIHTDDNRYILIGDSTAKISNEKPSLKYASSANRKVNDIGPYLYKNMVYSKVDSLGTVWLITREGDIVTAPSTDGPFSTIGHIDAPAGTLYYATTDSQNNIWLRSSSGVHKVTLGHLPYREITPQHQSMIRTIFRDSHGRLWMSESDTQRVAVYDNIDHSPRYLGSDGVLHDTPVVFGSGVYSFYEYPDGTIWIGSKPDGLFRLKPLYDSAYSISHLNNELNVYDITADHNGRLWIATMGSGIFIIDNPAASHPELRKFPSSAKSVRHITVCNDSLVLAATTAGLLAIRPDTMKLFVSDPLVTGSLGNVAVMDAVTGSDGSVLVATESDGVNIVRPNEVAHGLEWTFTSRNASSGLSDVALSIARDGEKAVIVSNNNIYVHRNGDFTRVASSWRSAGSKIRFSDGRPVKLDDSSWIVGHDNGAILFDAMSAPDDDFIPRMMFTRANIESRTDSIFPAASDTIILSSSERNISLSFTALDYLHADEIYYRYRIDDDDWLDIGSTGKITLLDLVPGSYKVEVSSISPSGQPLDNSVAMTIIVTPTFWETGFARFLYVVISLLIITAVIRLIVYIRTMKRQQREILDAYLELQQLSSTTETAKPHISENLTIDDDDKLLMDRVVGFVNTHLSDSEVTVDDMAADVGISRSSLNRKMKNLMGVSPAEYLRESRLNKAAAMLTDTTLPIKAIAADCGFSDINYFGKCFKASRGITPAAYRKS